MTRNRKTTKLLTLILIATISTLPGSAATLHGTIYDWSTFEPLENTIVEINTTPPQTYVAIDGKYSFEVPPGNYQIIANHYQNNTIEYTASENITITRDGNFILDILLLPPLIETDKIEDPLIDEINLSEPIVIPEEEKNHTVLIMITLFSALVLIAALLLKKYYHKRIAPEQKPKTEPTLIPVNPFEEEPTIEEKMPEKLPEDLQKVVDIISKNGGRMTQKDLRKHLNLSEAKISLMVSDLEERGIIDKIKKGRGNILVHKK